MPNLDKTYRFYAAFENTLCKDYVSEKLLFALRKFMIPVVYGGANYSYFAPPKSYINANDFKTVKDLGNYLKFLTRNPKEYLRYFWWKKYYSVESIQDHFCSLCEKLHSGIQLRSKVYKDVKR